MNRSKLILGTVQLGLDYGINNGSGKPSQKEAFVILDKAAKNGVGYLDTAAAYGNSEEVIGNYHRQTAGNAFNIITKFHTSDQSPHEVIETALNRLSIDRIDTLLFHSYAEYKKLRETEVYEELKSEVGKTVSRLGVSLYNNEELQVVGEDATIEVVQLPFNLLDNEASRGTVLKKLKRKGKIIHTRSVFLQGLFFRPVDSLFQTLRPLSSYLHRLLDLSDKSDIPLGAVALQYVLSKKYIDGVLFGVESADQLETNLNWLSEEISGDLFNLIDTIKVTERHLLNPSNW